MTCTNIEVFIQEDNLISDSLQIIKVVRPNWDLATVNHKIFTDGITNKLVGFFADNFADVVMVKVYGANTDLMIDRAEEIKTMQLLHSKKCGPELYATFENGISYEFISGVTLNVDSCRDVAVYPLVAAAMAKLHSSIPLGQERPLSLVWSKMRSFNQLGQDILRNNNTIGNKLQEFGITLDWGNNAINELENIVLSKNIPITFCHNDLLLGNIIYDDKKSQVSFIDFEYAMPNYPPFDVANHFNEFAGVDGADFSKCPTRELKSQWITEYLRHLSVKWNISQDSFEYWVELCIPVSHLFWILWAIVQAQYSTIDFDFAGYAGLRVVEFEKVMSPIREKELQDS